MESGVSKEAIERYVQKILENPATNLALVPDSIERKVYLLIIESVLKTVNNMLSLTEIKLPGHKLKLVLVPDE